MPAPSDNRNYPFRKPLTGRSWLYLVIPALVAAVEIQFSRASWDALYFFLKYSLDALDEFFSTTEQFATFTVMATVALVIWIYRQDLRGTLVPLLCAVLISSLAVNAIKFSTGRARPKYGWKMGKAEQEEISSYLNQYSNTVLEPVPGDYWLWFSRERPGTEIFSWISGRLPFGEERGILSISNYSSFPSGHAAGAFVLAAYLARVLPKGRFLWYLLAVGCALARVRYRRHYPGDVILGAGIGMFAVQAVFAFYTPFDWGTKVQKLIEGGFQKKRRNKGKSEDWDQAFPVRE